MKKFSTKVIALVCVAALSLSVAACSKAGGKTGGRETSDGTKRGKNGSGDPTVTTDVTDPTDPTDPTVPGAIGDFIPTSDTLTYPDHVAAFEEIHPSHTPGNVSGADAVKLLNEVETDVLHHEINCYADIEILFKDPEKLGYKVDDISWGESTGIDGYEEEKQYYQGLLDKLLTIDYDSLTGEDRLCYDRLVYDFEENIYGYSYTAFEYYEMIFNYLVGPQCEVLFILDVYSFDTVEDADNYILLLKDIDRYYDSMCEYEEERAALGFASSDTSYEEAAKSFDSLVEQKDDCFLYDSFEERLDNIQGLSSTDKDRLIKDHEAAMKDIVFPEFQECADRMRGLKGSGGVDAGLFQYRGGDAYYAMLTRVISNSTASLDESVAAVDGKLDSVFTEFNAIRSSGNRAWADEYLNHKYSKGDVQDNLDFLLEAVKRDFPDIPAHGYYLMDVPEVFEEYFSPAAYLGYHLDSFEDNVIIVNNAQVDDDFGVTIAHEGYPGHMFQSIYTRAHTTHPYMHLSVPEGYLEGWATYVENYSMGYFADDPNSDGAKMITYVSLLSLLASTRIEFGIHMEGWTLTECVDYLNNFGFRVTEDSFLKYYILSITDPGYYIKYGMGYVWTQKIMDDMHAKYPDATDKDIHTAYLDSLTGNFTSIEKNMDTILG